MTLPLWLELLSSAGVAFAIVHKLRWMRCTFCVGVLAGGLHALSVQGSLEAVFSLAFASGAVAYAFDVLTVAAERHARRD